MLVIYFPLYTMTHVLKFDSGVNLLQKMAVTGIRAETPHIDLYKYNSKKNMLKNSVIIFAIFRSFNKLNFITSYNFLTLAQDDVSIITISQYS
jgi:hypothetical protein